MKPVIVLFALLLVCAGCDDSPATAAVSTGPNACVEALKAQYAAQWPTMTAPERAAIGLRAAACE